MTIAENAFPITITLPLRMAEGGSIRIGTSRISLEIFMAYYFQGMNAEQLADRFETLDPEHIHYVIGYYLQNKEAVEAYLHQSEVEAQEIQAKIEAMQERTGFAEKLREIKARMKKTEI